SLTMFAHFVRDVCLRRYLFASLTMFAHFVRDVCLRRYLLAGAHDICPSGVIRFAVIEPSAVIGVPRAEKIYK
ncbi:MAG: hypothetical protein KDG51_05880, partial [Calditrichaeota bacterium]|nr:hypothetical protein [Calditrichota bacterium]